MSRTRESVSSETSSDGDFSSEEIDSSSEGIEKANGSGAEQENGVEKANGSGEDTNNIKEDEEALKKLEIEEMEVYARHFEVKVEQAKLLLKVMKSQVH